MSLSCRWLHPWDVEHLLSLLDSWALASSLTTFKLAWKTAALLVLVTAKHFSDLSFYVLIISTFFCSVMLLFFLASGGMTDWLVHLLGQIHIEHYSKGNLCPVLKAYLHHTESFKESDGLHVYSLFWVTVGSPLPG